MINKLTRALRKFANSLRTQEPPVVISTNNYIEAETTRAATMRVPILEKYRGFDIRRIELPDRLPEIVAIKPEVVVSAFIAPGQNQVGRIANVKSVIDNY